MPYDERTIEVIETYYARRKLTTEEREKLDKCLDSMPKTKIWGYGIGGALLTLGLLHKHFPKKYLPYIGAATCFLTMGIVQTHHNNMCVMKIVPPNYLGNVGIDEQTKQKSQEVAEEPAFTLPSALEFDDPIPITQSFSDDTSIPTLGVDDISIPALDEVEKPQPKKFVTYEELRQKHRQEYQKELENRRGTRTQDPLL